MMTLIDWLTGSVRHSGACVISRLGYFIVCSKKVRQRYENLSNCQILQDLPNQIALEAFLHSVGGQFAFFLEVRICFYGLGFGL